VSVCVFVVCGLYTWNEDIGMYYSVDNITICEGQLSAVRDDNDNDDNDAC